MAYFLHYTILRKKCNVGYMKRCDNILKPLEELRGLLQLGYRPPEEFEEAMDSTDSTKTGVLIQNCLTLGVHPKALC